MVNVVTIAAYRLIYWLRLIGLVQRSAATWRCVQHSSDEPGELSQWQCHDDSTTNIINHLYCCHHHQQCHFITVEIKVYGMV